MWQPLLAAIGQPELATDTQFNTLEARWQNREALDAIIESWTRQRGKHDVMRRFGEAGMPSGACQDTGEVLADPHLCARDMIVDVDFPTRGIFQTVGLSDSPPAAGRTHE